MKSFRLCSLFTGNMDCDMLAVSMKRSAPSDIGLDSYRKRKKSKKGFVYPEIVDSTSEYIFSNFLL